LEQRDLLFGEGANFLTKDGDRPDEPVLLEHRYANQRSSAGQFGEPYQRRLALDIGLLRPDVGDVLQLLRRDQPAEGGLRSGMDRRVALRQLVPFPRRVVQRNAPERIAFVQEQIAELGLADARRVRQHRLEHRLKLAWRTADYLENLRRRGLLLQGL